METQELHRGRLIDHIQLVVRDLAASQKFYESIFKILRIPMGGEGNGYFWVDELFVSSADSEAAHGELTGRHHLAFQAQDEAMVDAFHTAALANGGKSNGAPGLREYHPGYYAAFVLDPDGNNIEAVYHGAAQRSAPSVEIRF
ncbi:MAG TPA: VOC family protein [Candidimonas sp.]|nr:VOC family protein [Candidimonas sp.]